MIVVTGLDGSGKSTLLERLETALKSDVAILRVPFIESERFKNNKALYDQCEFVNYLGKKADEEQHPSLKIISMFGAMILFNQLHIELSKSGKAVFCERHPLIDTAVYARVYHKVMHPEKLNDDIAKAIESKFPMELAGIMESVNAEIALSDKGKCHDLLGFLYDWFSDEENYSMSRLMDLFAVKSPNAVYFLDAPAEELMRRMGDRKVKEFHEKEELLHKMRPIYLNILNQEGLQRQVVDSTDAEQLESVFEELLRNAKD